MEILTPAEGHERGELNISAFTRRLVAGDEEAYRMFFALYFDRLLRYLLVVCRGREDEARDVLQETLGRVARYIKVFSEEEAFWSWLTVLARSSRSDRHRKRRRYLVFLDRFMRHSLVNDQIANSENHPDQLNLLLDREMAVLAAEERQLLKWKYFDHMPVKEIAERMLTTDKAIESRLTRLRSKLKEAVLTRLKNEKAD